MKMRARHSYELQSVGGGDNDGDIGEAEARTIMENTGGRPQDCSFTVINGSVHTYCDHAESGGNIVIHNFSFDGDDDEDE
jgi:hypothetical protein